MYIQKKYKQTNMNQLITEITTQFLLQHSQRTYHITIIQY